MRERIISFFRDRGRLVSASALDCILRDVDPMKLAEEVAGRVDKVMIEEEDVGIRPGPEPVVVAIRKSGFKPIAKEYDSEFKEFTEYNVTGESLSEGKIEDFIECFRDRFKRLSGILKQRKPCTKSIETLKRRGHSRDERVIGMVQSIKTTKNGHRFMVIEDETTNLNVLVSKNDTTLLRFAESILVDEVIAVDGVFRKNLFIANKIVRPDVPKKEHNRSEEDLCIAMLSDTHVGSKLFKEKQFLHFLNWINGRTGNKAQQELAGKVKYITIAGDLVDGCGIYPTQEEELSINDIYAQYKKFAEFMEQIPDYIKIVAIPGNHDAVRVADPQPAIAPDILGSVSGIGNFHMMSSPGYCSLHGVEVLMYHGASIHNMVPHLPGLDYTKPEKVIRLYLERRHLHPVYGERPPITPEKKDYMVIDRVPDIVQVGDIHKNGYLTYKGIIGVNAGTWQARTGYQIQKGHHPTPCILPIVNLHSGKLNIIHFDKEVAM